jgi:hypothetical protein
MRSNKSNRPQRINSPFRRISDDERNARELRNYLTLLETLDDDSPAQLIQLALFNMNDSKGK